MIVPILLGFDPRLLESGYAESMAFSRGNQEQSSLESEIIPEHARHWARPDQPFSLKHGFHYCLQRQESRSRLAPLKLHHPRKPSRLGRCLLCLFCLGSGRFIIFGSGGHGWILEAKLAGNYPGSTTCKAPRWDCCQRPRRRTYPWTRGGRRRGDGRWKRFAQLLPRMAMPRLALSQARLARFR